MAVFDSRAGAYDRWYRTRLGNFADLVERGGGDFP